MHEVLQEDFMEVFHEVYLKLETSISFNTLRYVYQMIGQLLHFDSSISEIKSNIQNIIWKKVRVLNKRLPNEEISDMETYEKGEMREDSVRTLP